MRGSVVAATRRHGWPAPALHSTALHSARLGRPDAGTRGARPQARCRGVLRRPERAPGWRPDASQLRWRLARTPGSPLHASRTLNRSPGRCGLPSGRLRRLADCVCLWGPRGGRLSRALGQRGRSGASPAGGRRHSDPGLWGANGGVDHLEQGESVRAPVELDGECCVDDGLGGRGGGRRRAEAAGGDRETGRLEGEAPAVGEEPVEQTTERPDVRLRVDALAEVLQRDCAARWRDKQSGDDQGRREGEGTAGRKEGPTRVS